VQPSDCRPDRDFCSNLHHPQDCRHDQGEAQQRSICTLVFLGLLLMVVNKLVRPRRQVKVRIVLFRTKSRHLKMGKFSIRTLAQQLDR